MALRPSWLRESCLSSRLSSLVVFPLCLRPLVRLVCPPFLVRLLLRLRLVGDAGIPIRGCPNIQSLRLVTVKVLRPAGCDVHGDGPSGKGIGPFGILRGKVAHAHSGSTLSHEQQPGSPQAQNSTKSREVPPGFARVFDPASGNDRHYQRII